MKQIAAATAAVCLSWVGPAVAQDRAAAHPSPAPGVAAPAEDRVPPVSSLVRDLGRDLRRLPSVESAVILGMAGGASAGLVRHDRSITSRATSSLTLDRIFESGEVLGGGTLQIGAAVATYAIGRARHDAKTAIVGADLVRAQIVNAAITQGVKLSVRRVRPDGGRYSFPSGHSSSSFAFAAVLGRHYGWKVGLTGHAVAAYVAASRLQENRHFASDVVFGAAIGIMAGRTVTIGRGAARVVAAPAVTRGAVGVTFAWMGGQSEK